MIPYILGAAAIGLSLYEIARLEKTKEIGEWRGQSAKPVPGKHSPKPTDLRVERPIAFLRRRV